MKRKDTKSYKNHQNKKANTEKIKQRTIVKLKERRDTDREREEDFFVILFFFLCPKDAPRFLWKRKQNEANQRNTHQVKHQEYAHDDKPAEWLVWRGMRGAGKLLFL